MEDVFDNLLYIVSDEMRSKMSPRIRFMVEDVIEIMSNGVLNQADPNSIFDYSLCNM